MQPTTVIVVADKTSLKRPFIFLNGVNMALCFFMLAVTVSAHRQALQTDKLDIYRVVQLYILGSGCLLLSVLGVCGACKENRWCLILFAVGMAAASQTLIINTALKYQPIYEKEVVNRESSFLAMMPLSENQKANRTLLDSMQAYYKCCGLVEGYKDWGSTVPASCLCKDPGRRCVRLRENFTIGAPKNQLIYQEPCLPIYMAAVKRVFSIVVGFMFGTAVFWMVLLVLSVKLMVQIKRKKDFLALLQTPVLHSY
ncbi:tetraspanin-8-like [Myripristis murdjan]|uniref:tetraspanin-8-like n=1 Tax=Myripristis murdjan TaxID=586833 RepID=UPI001175D89C|nr:tetraspanin-8-like [Myripristis murdjan]